MKAIQATARRGGLCAATVAAALLVIVAGALPAAAAGSGKATLSGVGNVNTASADELQLLPGVGPSRAAAIVAVRQSRGGFSAVEDLTQVKGIGASMLERMRPHVSLEGKTTARRVPGGKSGGGEKRR